MVRFHSSLYALWISSNHLTLAGICNSVTKMSTKWRYDKVLRSFDSSINWVKGCSYSIELLLLLSVQMKNFALSVLWEILKYLLFSKNPFLLDIIFFDWLQIHFKAVNCTWLDGFLWLTIPSINYPISTK